MTGPNKWPNLLQKPISFADSIFIKHRHKYVRRDLRGRNAGLSYSIETMLQAAEQQLNAGARVDIPYRVDKLGPQT